jgi:hypothetical protein
VAFCDARTSDDSAANSCGSHIYSVGIPEGYNAGFINVTLFGVAVYSRFAEWVCTIEELM